MTTLTFNLCLQYADFQLQTGEVAVPLAGVTAIFGPSGCGKSSLIRALAGLEKAQGKVWFGDEVWQQEGAFKPVHLRQIGMVFQDGGLLPHLSVQQNLDYAIKRSKISKVKAQHWIERFQLQRLLKQYPQTLSGGQVQRVAIARALLANAKILMLDEPMSALDWQSKNDLIPLIKQVADEDKVPVLLISHSPDEVERLADRLLLMKQGRVEQVCSLQQALADPESPLFDHQGAVSVLWGQWRLNPSDLLPGMQPVQIGHQTLWLPASENSQIKRKNETVRMRILARDVSLSLSEPEGLSIVNHLQGRIVALFPQSENKVWVKLQLPDEQTLFSEITAYSCQRLQLQEGQQVFALIKSVVVSV